MGKPISLIFMMTALIAGCSNPSFSVAKPDPFLLGDNISTTKKAAMKVCKEVVVKEIIPITAPLARQSQTQIDCYGYHYAGAQRKIELVFQDNQLDLIWILIEQEDIPILIQHFTKQYGLPSMTIDFGTLYLQANAAVRNTPPEVLFVSPRQAEAMLSTLPTTSNGHIIE